MAWNLTGHVKRRTVLGEKIYDLEIGNSYSYSSSFEPEPGWLNSATCYLSICGLKSSTDLLLDYGNEISEAIPKGGAPENGICWAKYSFEDKRIDIILGLNNSDFSRVVPSLDTSLVNRGLQIRLFLQGGFSSTSPNLQSNQPTTDEFEAGKTLPLQPEIKCWLEQAAKMEEE